MTIVVNRDIYGKANIGIACSGFVIKGFPFVVKELELHSYGNS